MSGPNQLYNIARKMFAEQDLHWAEDATIRVALSRVSSASAFNENHTTFSEISSADLVAYEDLTGRAVMPNGACDAAPVQFEAVASGPAIKAIIIFLQAGSAMNSPENILLAYLGNAVGLDITPNGGNIIVTWDTGPNKIFRL